MRNVAFSNWTRRALHRVVAMIWVALMLAPLPGTAFGQAAPSGSSIKIGIIGSGNIGSTVGTLWVKAGHQVLFSSRHPENLKQLVDGLGPRARAGTVSEALTFGDVIFIGVPYGAYPQLAKDYGKEFSGKIVLDAGNAVLARDGEIGKDAREKGVALTSARLLAGARIVRAFNIMNFRKVASYSNRPEGRIAMPIAGDDQEALKVASGLVRDAGFDPVVVGSLQRSKLFEQGGPLYGAEMSAQEMRERLKSLQ
ncbi:MAG TPA: NADPH-dependent F420 reductase [Candidatus Binatia bacterium]|nr:NADPH-dependent F420 reductase [Candidatus Binatia bacterium]